MGKLRKRPFSRLVNRAERITAIRESKLIPDGVKDLAIHALRAGDDHTDQLTGSHELAWRRGYHSGYIDGYKDAKKRKAAKWT